MSFAELAKASVLPSGDHTGEPAPWGTSVRALASPPWVEIRWICGGSPWPSFMAERVKAIREPSGDHRGEESDGPLVNERGGSLPSVGTIQRAVS